MFHGSIVALITPFLNGKIDLAALENLVNWQIDAGTQAIVACGSTGEGSLLTLPEWQSVVQKTVAVAARRVPIIAGCGTPGTSEALILVQQAQTLGADAALIMAPYYVKPSSQGIYAHFQAIHDATQLPIIVYNNLARASVDMSVELIGKLSQLPRIVGLKECHTDISRIIALRRLTPSDFALLSGDDLVTSAYLAGGGHGCISTAANAAPQLSQELMVAWFKKDMDRFAELRDRLNLLHCALLAETNPISIKCAVALLGRCQNELRLPLLPAQPQTQLLIKEALQTIGAM